MHQYTESMELLEMMQELGLLNHPHYRYAWQAGHSPLPAAAKFRARLRNRLVPMLVEKRLRPPVVSFPLVPADKAVTFGSELTSHRPVVIHRDRLTRHVIIAGTTGCGKTTESAALIGHLLLQGMTVEFADHKDEGGRLLTLYPDALVIRADQELVNVLEPLGPPEIYWSALFCEIAKVANLRVEAWNELPEVMVQIWRQLKLGEPGPSMQDLVGILFRLAKDQRRPKLATVARALRALNVVLGKMARVRRAPDVFERFQFVVRQYHGLPARFHNFLTALRVLRMQMRGSAAGHSSTLQHVYISDEGSMEFGREMSGETGSGYVRATKRLVSQIRSQGVGIIITVQMLYELDDSAKSNAATLMFFRCPNPRDAQEALVMLGLDGRAMRQIMTLPVGRAFVFSEGFSGPALVDVPYMPLGDYPSAAEIARRMRPALEKLEQDSILSDDSEATPTVITPRDQINPPVAANCPSVGHPALCADDQALLDEIKASPLLGTTDHFRRLFWSFRRGDRAKNRLLNRRLIRVDRQQSNNGRPKDILVILATP
jgi:hypothetical protein